MIRRQIITLLRSPGILLRLTTDRVFVPTWLRLLGVQSQSGCRFNGQPIIQLASGAQIQLGRSVLVNSRTNSNAAGISHPCILAAVYPGSKIEIGSYSGLSGASLVARTAILIGDRVLIGAGACIWDNDFHPLDPAIRQIHPTRDALSAAIHIEDDVFIGARAIVLKGVHIGRGAVIGAGSVVAQNVEAATVVAGNPARVIRSAATRG